MASLKDPTVRPPRAPRPELALNGLRIFSVACSPSESGATVLSVRWGRWNVAELHLGLHFPTPSCPTMSSCWQAVSATLLSQWLVWGLSGGACGEPVLSFFSQDKLNFTSSGLIKSFVSKIVTQPLGDSSFPTSSQLKIMRKTIDQVKRSIFPFFPRLP